MAGLTPAKLLNVLLRSLPEGSKPLSGSDDVRPAVINVPNMGTIRVYLWTATHDHSLPGKRPAEIKIQLKLPGQLPRNRGRLETADYQTFLLGYLEADDLFVAWPALNHSDFGYSASLQAPLASVIAARVGGWSTTRRRLQSGKNETVVIFTAHRLSEYFKTAAEHGIDLNGEEPLNGTSLATGGLSVDAAKRSVTDPTVSHLATLLGLDEHNIRLTIERRYGPQDKAAAAATVDDLLRLARPGAGLVEIACDLDPRVALMLSIWNHLGQSSEFPLNHRTVLERVYEDERFVGKPAPRDFRELVLGALRAWDPSLAAEDVEDVIEGDQPTLFCYQTLLAHLEGQRSPAASTDIEDTSELAEDEPEDEDSSDIDPVKALVTKYSVKQLFEYVEGHRLNLQPPWQRKDVWSPKKKRKLVESLILGIPLPSIILHKRGREFLVIDGKQRLTAIQQFMQNEYKLSDFDVASSNPLSQCRRAYYNKLDRKSLPDDIRLDFELREIPALLFEDVGEETLRRIFALYNVSGTHLNAAEIRNAIYQANPIHRALYALAGEVTPLPDLNTGDYEGQVRFTQTLRATLPSLSRYAAVDFLCRYLGYSRAAQRSPSDQFRPGSTAATIDRFFEFKSQSENPIDVVKEIVEVFGTTEKYFDIDDERLPFYRRNERTGDRKFNALIAVTNMVATRFLLAGIRHGLLRPERARAVAAAVKVEYPDNQQTATIWDFQGRVLLAIRDESGVDASSLGEDWEMFFARMSYAVRPAAEAIC